MLNFLNLKSFFIHLFFGVASSLSTLWLGIHCSGSRPNFFFFFQPNFLGPTFVFVFDNFSKLYVCSRPYVFWVFLLQRGKIGILL